MSVDNGYSNHEKSNIEENLTQLRVIVQTKTIST